MAISDKLLVGVFPLKAVLARWNTRQTKILKVHTLHPLSLDNLKATMNNCYFTQLLHHSKEWKRSHIINMLRFSFFSVPCSWAGKRVFETPKYLIIQGTLNNVRFFVFFAKSDDQTPEHCRKHSMYGLQVMTWNSLQGQAGLEQSVFWCYLRVL